MPLSWPSVLSPALALTPHLQSGPWTHRWFRLQNPAWPSWCAALLPCSSPSLAFARSSRTGLRAFLDHLPTVQTAPHTGSRYTGHQTVGPLLARLSRIVIAGPSEVLFWWPPLHCQLHAKGTGTVGAHCTWVTLLGPSQREGFNKHHGHATLPLLRMTSRAGS